MDSQLVLASASPRRSELLNQIGISHSIHAVDIDESPWTGESALAYTERVANEKSAACRALLTGNLPVLAADTCVVCDGEILGKPRNEAHALEMLSKLSGRSHEVYSAVSLRGHGHWQAMSVSEVTFRKLGDSEILSYWLTGEPYDKAGAYAIQGLGSIFVESIRGSFSGVMGLPLFETAQLLAKQGIRVIT
ncbi:Maf family protein [Methylomonas sp. MgM2]